MKLNAIVIDADPHALEQLKNTFRLSDLNIEISAIAGTVQKAGILLKKLKPDLVFTEVQLQDGTVFDLFDGIEPRTFEIIFITRYENYGARAFACEATDYLIKPLKLGELTRAVDKAIKKLALTNSILRSENEIRVPGKLALPTKKGYKLVPMQDIIRLQAEGSYVLIHTRYSKPQLVSRTLKNIACDLKSDLFIRVHRSHLINLHYVSEYCKTEGGYVVMENGDRVEVASQRKQELLSKLLD